MVSMSGGQDDVPNELIHIGIDSTYMLLCSVLSSLIILGIGLFYSGITQRRSSFTMLSVPIMAVPVAFIDWFIWSYSLSFAPSSNRFIGSLTFAALRHLKDDPLLVYSTSRGDILLITHFMFSGILKCICVALTFPGCVAERGRLIPMFLFLLVWSWIVYNPISCWLWQEEGWLSSQNGIFPVLDFAGGNCIHVVSGFTTLAYSYVLGERNPKLLYDYNRSNNSYVIIGTAFMLIGWLGFVGGCEYHFSYETIYIFTDILLCASASGVVWTLMDYYSSAYPLGEIEPEHGQLSPAIKSISFESRFSPRKLSAVSFCSGVMAGLVTVTPAGGYIASSSGLWKPFVFGIIGSFLCNFATRLKYFVMIDDALDIFAIHGVAGIVGSLLTGLFGENSNDYEIAGTRNRGLQFGYQLLASVVTAVYVFVVSLAILYIINLIPGLHLRIDKNYNKGCGEDADEYRLEYLGMDEYEFNGEYSQDFVEFIRELNQLDYESDNVSWANEVTSEEVYSNI